jgi:glycolate oxidase FAD binding subunit
VELDRLASGGPISVGVLLEGSADGVAARAEEMQGLLSAVIRSGDAVIRSSDEAAPGTEVVPGAHAMITAPASAPPGCWGWVPLGGDDATLLRVSFWVSALAVVLEAIDAAARETGLRPSVMGSAGAGALYVTLPAAEASGGVVARFVGRVRAALPAGRGGAVLLSAPAAVRAALAGDGGLAGATPGLALMRAVKDQFDPGHRMAPGRFPT